MKKVLPVLFISLYLLAAQASAQSIGTPGPSTGPVGWGMNNLFYSNRVFNGMVANSLLRKGAQKNNRASTSNQPSSAKGAIDYTVFREAPGILLTKTLSDKNNGNNQPQIEQMVSQFIGLYQQTAKKDGFPSNDLAYALEYFIVNNYQLYYHLISLPSDKDPYLKKAKDGFDRITLAGEKQSLQNQIYQERALYNQLKTLLQSNPEIQKMTDPQKQELTELLAVMFGVNFAGYMKGVNETDEKLIEQARQMAQTGLEKLLGVPISQIKITGAGLAL